MSDDSDEKEVRTLNPFEMFPIGSLGLPVDKDMRPEVEHIKLAEDSPVEEDDTIHPSQVDKPDPLSPPKKASLKAVVDANTE